MSDASDFPPPPPPRVLPVRPAPPPPPPPRGGGGWRVLFVLLLLGSLGLNVLLVCGGLVLGGLSGAETEGPPVREKFHGGTSGASDKVAVVSIEGVIMESALTYAHKQIDRAAGDKNVKAVVVRIESPGGTITASDDLHRRLTQLRDGTTPKYQGQNPAPKPLVVSMGNLAASGGYYVAMPAKKAHPEDKKLFAEPTTITGSIGVYASFPDVHKLADKYGVGMKMIKAGDIKGSGSPFHEMTPQERQPWDDMVSHAYDRFLGVVADGRPPLTKDQLATDVVMRGEVPLLDDKGNPVKGDDGKPKTEPYTRKRADGGIFTAEEAVKFGLVDAVGTVDDAIAEAASQAGLSKYRAVVYERPATLLSLLSAEGTAAGPTDLGRLVTGLGPRVWYLIPQAEPAAVLQPLRRE
jgi:protease-4